MTDAKFERFIIEWSSYLRTWRSQSPIYDAAVASLTSITYRKNAGSSGDVDLSESFAEQNDMMFGVRVLFPENLKHNGHGRFYGAASLVTEPLFMLPVSSNIGMFVLKPADYEACSYLHEFGHFVQYALAKAPLQAASTLVLVAASGQIPLG